MSYGLEHHHVIRLARPPTWSKPNHAEIDDSLLGMRIEDFRVAICAQLSSPNIITINWRILGGELEINMRLGVGCEGESCLRCLFSTLSLRGVALIKHLGKRLHQGE